MEVILKGKDVEALIVKLRSLLFQLLFSVTFVLPTPYTNESLSRVNGPHYSETRWNCIGWQWHMPF